MAPLPKDFSLQAIPIRTALSEGREEDAKTLIIRLLRAGAADRAVQGLAADMLRPPKRKRGRRSAAPKHWFEIGVEFYVLRADGTRYNDALESLAARFGYSETHIRNAVAAYDSAKDADTPIKSDLFA